MPSLGRPGWLWVVAALGASLSCGGSGKPGPRDGSVGPEDTSLPVRRGQMLTAATNARGQARIASSASVFADVFLIDADTQKPVEGAKIEALPEEEDDDGFFVRVSKDAEGYRPALVRVQRGGQRTVPLTASTADVPGRAVRVSQKVFDDEYLGEADLAGVSARARTENLPEIVFSPVLDAAGMASARFHMYRSPLPATLLALKVDGARPATGSSVRTRSRVVSTSGVRRAGVMVQPQQVTAAAERRDDDGHVAPVVSSLVIGTPDSNGDAMVTWGVQDSENRLLAFEVGVNTTRPSQRVAPSARSLAISVRAGEHYVCVRPVFPGADLESELRCQWFQASAAPAAANVRVRVRPPAAGAARRRQPMPVEVEVENLGSVDTDPFKIDVVLSRDGRTEGGLGEVRTLTVDGVKAGGRAVRRTEITPPQDGNLYIVARADSTRQLVETNAEDNLDRRGVEVMPLGDNRSPILSVGGTAVGGGEGGRLVRGQFLKLRAAAADVEDGDLSSGIRWISSRDGMLGNGPGLDTNGLTPGLHRVRAQVADLGRPAAQLPPAPLPWWRRLFGVDPPAPVLQAAEPPETVTAEFTIEVVDSELARSGKSPPQISAGPDLTTTVGGQVVPLASASDPDGDTLSFAWTARDAAGATVEILDGDALLPRFRPAAPGSYRLSLVVGDGTSEERDELVVLALAPEVNHAPLLALTLPGSGRVGTAVRATITASDEDGDGLTLSYELTRPPGSTVLLGDGETRTPAFVPDLPGVYRLIVMADDGRGRTTQAQASTTVSGPDPLPDAGVPDAPPSDGPTDVQPDTGPVIPQANGSTCGGRLGCTSGHCVDGICCDSPCLGLCASCTLTGQAGVCTPVPAGQDPREDCPSSGTCNGQGACSPVAVRAGGELLVSGTVELAGSGAIGIDPIEGDHAPAACDPGSGFCAFLRTPGGQLPTGQVELWVFDGRATGPVSPRQLSENANSFGPPNRPGFVRGTLVWGNTAGETLAWRPGWTEPHRLAPTSAICTFSRGGRFAACLSNFQPSGDLGETFDLKRGPLVDGGSPLPVVQTLFRTWAEIAEPVFSDDEAWLALRARSSSTSLPAIFLQGLPSGSPAPTVISEEALDTDLSFSPDSRFLAFRRGIVEGEGEGPGTLAVASVSATPTVRDLVPGTFGFAWWRTPAGAGELLFISDVVDRVGTLGKIADPANPQRVNLADRANLEYVLFAPAAGRMTLVRDSNGDQIPELWAVNLGDGSLFQVSSGPQILEWSYGQLSLAGDKMAVVAGEQAGLSFSPLVPGAGPFLPLGDASPRMAFTASGALVFAQTSYRGGGVTRTAALGGGATLRVYDGKSYPPRVLQPGVLDTFAVLGETVMFVVAGQGSSDGLYRVRLDATAPGPSCDPLLQSGCTSGTGCFLRGPGDVATCAPAGSGGQGADCASDASCSPGSQCHAGRCQKICAAGATTCPGETPYCQVAPGNAALGLCGPAPGCDPVLLTGCPADDYCQVSAAGAHACGPAGIGSLGQPCDVSAECSPGSGCFSDNDGTVCRRYCDTRSPSCPSETICRSTHPSTWVGYCAPSDSQTGCNVIAQTGCAGSEQACYLQPGSTICLPSGSSPLGAACDLPGDCAPGLSCLDGSDGRRCRSHCVDPSCPTGMFCAPVAPNAGACLPSSGGPDGGPVQ